MEETIVIGKIVAPHGVRGEFRIMPQTDYPERYTGAKHLQLDTGAVYEVENIRPHKQFYLVKVAGIEDMDAAERLRGRTIVVPASQLPKLPEGQFYVRDILGFSVISPEGELLGTVADVIQPASTAIFVIHPAGGGEDILVAAIAENIKQIDWEKQQVIAVLPEWI